MAFNRRTVGAQVDAESRIAASSSLHQLLWLTGLKEILTSSRKSRSVDSGAQLQERDHPVHHRGPPLHGHRPQFRIQPTRPRIRSLVRPWREHTGLGYRGSSRVYPAHPWIRLLIRECSYCVIACCRYQCVRRFLVIPKVWLAACAVRQARGALTWCPQCVLHLAGLFSEGGMTQHASRSCASCPTPVRSHTH